MSENDNGITNARILNTYAILQSKLMEDVAEDRENFIKSLSRALEILFRAIIDQGNAQAIYDFLKEYNRNAQLFLKNQAEAIAGSGDLLGRVAQEMGIVDECIEDMKVLEDAVKDDDGDGQPFPGILSTLIDKADGFGVINAETGEITKLSKDEFMRKIGGQKE